MLCICRQLSDLDIVSLCRHLRTCTNGGGVGLDVDLSSNRIGDRGAEVLAQTLEESPDCLKSLNIQNNFIGNRGWKALYCAILKSSIQQVCVLQNPITLSNLHRGKLGEIFPQCRIELDQAIFQSGRYSQKYNGSRILIECYFREMDAPFSTNSHKETRKQQHTETAFRCL